MANVPRKPALSEYTLRFILERFGFPAAEGISKVHGKIFQREDLFAPVKIVALYHPAVATYNPGSYATLEKDFAALATL